MPKKTLEKEQNDTAEGTQDEFSEMESEAGDIKKEMEDSETPEHIGEDTDETVSENSEEAGETGEPQNPEDAFKNVSKNTMPLEMEKGLCPRCLSLLEVVKEKVDCTNCTHTSTEDIKVKLGDLISLSTDGVQGDISFDKKPEPQPKETMVSMSEIVNLLTKLETEGCLIDVKNETEIEGTEILWMSIVSDQCFPVHEALSKFDNK